MRIYSMTATFGKLEHETLTLKPGLNIIHAPNEWGKSTWCAFLLAMLYGLDTRAKSTKTTLADKERYAPWSGNPMAGRMEINWRGRDITIERKSKGRVPLGDFRAYETSSGLEVKELTAANCGEKLLGVERSVFVRSGFIRFNDLSVMDGEALRRRLNALVTTGDERGTGDLLAKGLKDLKNHVRYNRTGLLPQAEEERNALEEKLRELESLQIQSEKAKNRLSGIEQRRILLENHRAALAYAASQEGARQVAQARLARDAARQRMEQTKAACESLPTREKAEQVLSQIHELQERQSRLQMELRLMPEQEPPVQAPTPFAGMDGEEAVAAAKADQARHEKWISRGNGLCIFTMLIILAGCIGAMWYRMPGFICAGAGAGLLILALIRKAVWLGKAKKIKKIYGCSDPDRWLYMAECYAQALQRKNQSDEAYWRTYRELEQRLQTLNDSIRAATNGQSLEQCRRDWEGAIAAWDAQTDAHRDWKRAENHYQTLKSMAKPAPMPEFPDEMDYSEADTARRLSDCFGELHRLENLLGQYQGRMESLGQRGDLEDKLTRINLRIAKLEETYAALTIAQETLAEAAAQLQRRFAPRIAKRAQELMGRMTGGRYDRLSLGEDLSLRAGAEQEDTLREALWRSDGTVDQLYLALRVAVAEELTPDAPLILDDALARFDDARLKSALEIFRAEAARKQVLLFSCHTREQNLADNTEH